MSVEAEIPSGCVYHWKEIPQQDMVRSLSTNCCARKDKANWAQLPWSHQSGECKIWHHAWPFTKKDCVQIQAPWLMKQFLDNGSWIGQSLCVGIGDPLMEQIYWLPRNSFEWFATEGNTLIGEIGGNAEECSEFWSNIIQSKFQACSVLIAGLTAPRKNGVYAGAIIAGGKVELKKISAFRMRSCGSVCLPAQLGTSIYKILNI